MRNKIIYNKLECNIIVEIRIMNFSNLRGGGTLTLQKILN